MPASSSAPRTIPTAITASSFFRNDGTKLPDDVELAIEQLCSNAPLETVEGDALGKAERIVDAAGRYIEFCKSTIDGSSLSLNGLKIVVDCANGATYHIAPEVFDELGAKVIAIGAQPDGLNINRDCGATSPGAAGQNGARSNRPTSASPSTATATG